jgi:hypothetical protein
LARSGLARGFLVEHRGCECGGRVLVWIHHSPWSRIVREGGREREP